MNTLSWLVYLAEVLPNLKESVDTVLLITLLGSLVYFFVLSMYCADTGHKFPTKQLWVYPVLATILMVTSLIPSRDTLYLIAGSEAGEYVVNTPEAKEILSDVKEVVKHQLEELKK